MLGKDSLTREILWEMYNPLPGLWERMDAGMVTLKNFGIICAGDGRFFALDLFAGLKSAGSVFAFCPAVGSWEHVATTPILHWCWSWAYDCGHIYGTCERRVLSLNVSTGQWDELPPLSTERHSATLRMLDGRLFVVGGLTASVEEYLLLERRWVSVSDMPTLVFDADAVALEGKLLVIGGATCGPGLAWPGLKCSSTIQGIAAGSSCPACSPREAAAR